MSAYMLASVRFYRLPPFALLLTLLCSPPIWAQWEPDVRLTYNDSASWSSFYNAKWIAAGPSGDVHVVWFDYRDGLYPRVYYKRSTDYGANWSPDAPFVGNLSSGYPTVVVSGNYVHIVWADNRAGNSELYYKRSTDSGLSWSSETRLTYAPAYDSWVPSLSVSGSAMHMVYREDYGPTPYIYYKRSTDSGASWSQDTLLINVSVGALPSVSAVDTMVHVVWSDFRSGVVDIFYKRSVDNGASWSPDIRLTNSQPSYGPPGGPTLAVSGPLVHVVWTDSRDSGSGGEIYYKRSTDSGVTWSLDTRLTFDPDGSGNPSICTSGSNVHLVWRKYRNRALGVSYKRSTDNGLIWGADTLLTPLDSIDRPCVAVSGPVVHVAWMDYRDGNWEIYDKRNPTGNSGVEEKRRQGIVGSKLERYKATPNPFTSFARIFGHEAESFALYDVSGRKVGVYKGDRIGEGLSAGIYFLKPEIKGAKPLRIVKLR